MPSPSKAPLKVLGIETSCDDTGVALYHSELGLLGHRLFSQTRLHLEYGGVVPELASRDHIRKLLPLIKNLLAETRTDRNEISGVAYTTGPGLAGALLVGAAIGRSLAFSLGVPAIGVHHMEGHLLAPMLEPDPPDFPFLALLVSGGHTMLADVQGVGRYKILGESIDDAVGEAFDKTAKLLRLGYPGGPAIARVAETGQAGRFMFPRPMTDRPGLHFSFSGLKTHVATVVAREKLDQQTIADIAHAFQEAAVDTLVIKCERALEETGHRRLVIAGGVSANKLLRARLVELGKTLDTKVYYPRPEFCTDNGAMIAFTGYVRLQAGQHEDLGFGARPRWNLETLPPLN